MSIKQNFSNIISIPCPECDSKIEVDKNAKIGSVVECPSCVTESEIIGLNPVTLVPLEEEK